MVNPLTSLLNRWTTPSIDQDQDKKFIFVKSEEGVNYGTKEALEVKKASSNASVFKKMSKQLNENRIDLKSTHDAKLIKVITLAAVSHQKYIEKHNRLYLFIFGRAEKKAFNALNNQIQSMLDAVAHQKNILDLSARKNQAEASLAALTTEKDRLTAISESDDSQNIKSLKEMSELRMLLKVYVANKEDSNSPALKQDEIEKMNTLWKTVPNRPKGEIHSQYAYAIVCAKIANLEKKEPDLNVEKDLEAVLKAISAEKKIVENLKADLEKAIRKEV